MTNSKHTIGTLHFELETYNKKHALEIQESVSRFGRGEISEIMEESLDRAGITNSTAIIDKLEIELGEISFDEFRTNFLSLFRKEFNKKITDFHFEDSVVKTKNARLLDKEKSEQEILKQFLLSGTIPWYAESTPPDLQAIFGNLVKTKPGGFLKFIKTHLPSANFLERVVYQFPEVTVIQLLEIIFETRLEEQLQFTKQIFSAIKESAPLSAKVPYPDKLMLKVLIETLRIAESKTDIGFKESYLKVLANKLEIKYSELVKLISRQIGELKLIPKTRKLLKKTKEIEDKQLKIGSKDDIVSKEIETESDEKAEPVAYYISNAGLSLLNPFLPELFRKLKLVSKNEFVDEAAIHKAIQLSQYAVFGNKAKPEYLLVLNKLICGYPLESPIPIKVNLSKREKAETTKMVNAAIKHWSALKNTSPKGFRESFLSREGLLKQTENGWKLLIERKAYDILLDKIPWNYRIIKLPWMDKLIEVEW